MQAGGNAGSRGMCCDGGPASGTGRRSSAFVIGPRTADAHYGAGTIVRRNARTAGAFSNRRCASASSDMIGLPAIGL